MPEITLRGRSVEYEVRRSSEASRARIDVRPSGISVTVPEGSGLDPEDFLREKRGWVLEKQGEVEDYLDRVPERRFEEDETLPVLGRERDIRVTKNDKGVGRDEVRVTRRRVENGSVEEAVEDVLRERARKEVQELLAEYGDEVDGDYGTVYVRNQKTKWASCSSKNNLSFNWRLVLAPPEVLEYVVVHELVHLEERNHSKAFWSRVSEILPDYRERREKLKEMAPELVLSKDDLV